jgi:hypothetical protein
MMRFRSEELLSAFDEALKNQKPLVRLTKKRQTFSLLKDFLPI